MTEELDQLLKNLKLRRILEIYEEQLLTIIRKRLFLDFGRAVLPFSQLA